MNNPGPVLSLPRAAQGGPTTLYDRAQQLERAARILAEAVRLSPLLARKGRPDEEVKDPRRAG